MSTALTEAEERMVTFVPFGYRHLMLIAAWTKRALTTLTMSDRDRLVFLERLNSLTDTYFTVAMLATIEPMGDVEMQMMHEARSLDPEGDKLGKASFDVLTGQGVFRHFIALNPSILAAIKIHESARAA